MEKKDNNFQLGTLIGGPGSYDKRVITLLFINIVTNRDIYRCSYKVRFLQIFANLPVLTYVLGAQKNCLIGMVLLSTHNM